ncbi:hypothetical protein SAMN05443377_1503 [Propionibacterium cyclohexanicum]|uniref:ABC-2 family transporter protein n=1 Tax=Propionibacterium cyclohexanicum TaxID=64702 RepID=A0A1H9U9P5_9ACTN|nr:hypothetical protein [Propionibacterium cyclohexanicum]SES05864.1 hypothetical protein SAMN05443377_1503 [Propionibacterium cyclohexanicum]
MRKLTASGRLLSIELGRAFAGRPMMVALAGGAAIVALHMTKIVPLSQEGADTLARFGPKPTYSPPSLYQNWLGYDMSGAASLLFLFLMPLLACLPYGTSLFDDRRRGYDINVVSRVSRTQFYLAKAAAVFAAGGVAVVFPLAIDLVATASFLPAIRPEVTNYGIPETGMWSALFFAHPLIYVLSYIAVNFLWGGTIAMLAMLAGYVVHNRIVVVTAPLIVLWIVAFGFASTPEGWAAKYSPMDLVNPHQVAIGISFGALAIEWLIVTGLAVGFLAMRARRDEAL